MYTDIQETVGPKQYDENPPLSARVKLVLLRLGTWFLALAIIVAAVYLIVYVTETSIDVSSAHISAQVLLISAQHYPY